MNSERNEMVRLIQAYGVRDEKIIEAMRKVRRHVFIPEGQSGMLDPYGDHPCPIGNGQTISQPFIVAYMSEKINPKPGEKILEIGTGSGYQAAVLAELGADVYSIEIIPDLANHAKKILAQEKYKVHILEADGYKGWPEMAPFDVIIVTCAPEEIPFELIQQLNEGGRMILPVGSPLNQKLVVLYKSGGKVKLENDLAVRFVPMVHRQS
ncbi:MAG: protein-L-isoaspartate(D-aspartate) O-methyltransferase [Candidatus Riflebacteria bacterium]|nr:protein-L-isoaspartate(D-aspartate) O-methyltransferase [Candidatus Riflebacteria bacterium]